MADTAGAERFLFNPDSIFVEGPIPPESILQCERRFSANGAVGAHLVFLGQVRADEIEAGTVTGIEYTAHESMARRAFATVVERVAREEPLLDVEIRHSLGYVPVGGASLLIAVAAGHRDEAYRISRRILEEIKADVPIYGRELTGEKGSQWKVNR